MMCLLISKMEVWSAHDFTCATYLTSCMAEVGSQEQWEVFKNSLKCILGTNYSWLSFFFFFWTEVSIQSCHPGAFWSALVYYLDGCYLWRTTFLTQTSGQLVVGELSSSSISISSRHRTHLLLVQDSPHNIQYPLLVLALPFPQFCKNNELVILRVIRIQIPCWQIKIWILFIKVFYLAGEKCCCNNVIA